MLLLLLLTVHGAGGRAMQPWLTTSALLAGETRP
jgi:hypothetical protein